MKGGPVGAGIAAGGLPPEAQRAVGDMKDQLLIALVRRLGGRVTIPVAEVDDTGGVTLSMAIDRAARAFIFEVRGKH